MKNIVKKGDGLATIAITIILVVIALLIVPVLKAFQANSGNNLKTEAETTQTIVGQAVQISGETGYNKIN